MIHLQGRPGRGRCRAAPRRWVPWSARTRRSGRTCRAAAVLGRYLVLARLRRGLLELDVVDAVQLRAGGPSCGRHRSGRRAAHEGGRGPSGRRSGSGIGGRRGGASSGSPMTEASVDWIQLPSGMISDSSRMKRSQSKRVCATPATELQAGSRDRGEVDVVGLLGGLGLEAVGLGLRRGGLVLAVGHLVAQSARRPRPWRAARRARRGRHRRSCRRLRSAGAGAGPGEAG